MIASTNPAGSVREVFGKRVSGEVGVGGRAGSIFIALDDSGRSIQGLARLELSAAQHDHLHEMQQPDLSICPYVGVYCPLGL